MTWGLNVQTTGSHSSVMTWTINIMMKPAESFCQHHHHVDDPRHHDVVMILLPSLGVLTSNVLLVHIGAKGCLEAFGVCPARPLVKRPVNPAFTSLRANQWLARPQEHQSLKKCSAERHGRRTQERGVSGMVFCVCSKTWRRQTTHQLGALKL